MFDVCNSKIKVTEKMGLATKYQKCFVTVNFKCSWSIAFNLKLFFPSIFSLVSNILRKDTFHKYG